jgi:hypothetical protein
VSTADISAESSPSDPTAVPQWRRSSYCANGACITVRAPGRGGDPVDVRDSKLPYPSPELHFTTTAWRDFIDAIKREEI